MGLFSKKPPTPSFTDRVWKSRRACMKGLAAEGLLALKNGEQPIVVTFFEEAQNAIVSFLESQSVPFAMLSSESVPATTLVVVSATSPNLKSTTEKVAFLFFGHYPLISVEQQLLEALRVKAPQSRNIFCLSLEDPLLDAFGGQNLTKVVESLGLGDDEFIEHAMVTKSIQRAREKLSEKVGASEMKTGSEREWFTRNLPA